MTYDWISFLTDYGRADGFVAACRGVIARIAAEVRVIDVSHDVPRQDVRHAAAVLAQTVTYLPASVHLAVVDPGVGTDRRPIALQTPTGLLVGPDNGLLCWAADALGGVVSAAEIAEPRYRTATKARTFDGRDIFAPAAAHLSVGVPLSSLGPSIDAASLVRLPELVVRVSPKQVIAEVLTVDHFGNVQLAASGAELARAGLEVPALAVTAAGKTYLVPVVSAFAMVGADELLVYVDAADHLAVALNQGSAAARLDVAPGDLVRLTVP